MGYIHPYPQSYVSFDTSQFPGHKFTFLFFFMMLEGLEYLSEEPGTVLLSERGVVAGNLEARCRDHGGGVNNVIRN